MAAAISRIALAWTSRVRAFIRSLTASRTPVKDSPTLEIVSMTLANGDRAPPLSCWKNRMIVPTTAPRPNPWIASPTLMSTPSNRFEKNPVTAILTEFKASLTRGIALLIFSGRSLANQSPTVFPPSPPPLKTSLMAEPIFEMAFAAASSPPLSRTLAKTVANHSLTGSK